LLNPNSALAWMASGYASFFQNRPGPAIEAFERGMRLSPLDPLGYLFTGGLAIAHFAAGRYPEAMEWVDRSLRELPRYAASIRVKVALCAELDQIDEARDWLRRLDEVQPGLTIAKLTEYATAIRLPPDVLTRYTKALRKAGLSEQ
jgi:adenylate cyclase